MQREGALVDIAYMRVYGEDALGCFLFLIFLAQLSGTIATMMKAAVYEPGGPENLFLGEAPLPELRPNEVLIKIHATAINRADTLQRKGSYPPLPGESTILGLEAAGCVEKLSSGSTKWSVGDRVMALLPGGGNAEYAAVHEDHLMKIPEEMSFTEAAAIPEVWLTAFQLLHFVGKVSPGEVVLIHAGGSAVGTAAVQLSVLAGAVPIVTAGTQAKLDKAVSLGAVHAFNYKEGKWAEKVLNATEGKGVNIILDPVGGSYWEQNMDSLALEGRWVLYGLLGGGNVDGNILGKILGKRATLQASTLRTRSKQYKAELISAFARDALPRFVTGQLKPMIDSTLPLAQISEAHARMEANLNSGKIVLLVQPEGDKEKSEL